MQCALLCKKAGNNSYENVLGLQQHNEHCFQPACGGLRAQMVSVYSVMPVCVHQLEQI